MKFRKQRGSNGDAGGLDTDSAFSDDASSMLSSSESSTSSTNVRTTVASTSSNGQTQPTSTLPKKVLVDIYCADGATKESILVDPLLTVGEALKLMAEKSCVECHIKWGLVERLPELFIDRCLEDDEKLLRVISAWKPQTPNRLIFAQRLEKYDLFRRPERYLLDPYDKTSTEAVMQTPWDAGSRQSLVQRCMDSISQASTTLLEGPLWLKTEGKKWKKFHFILRDYNLFQTTKSKKGSVHDVHFVASLATVKVYNGIGWKKRYKAPTDFCFALKPPEVQERKAHIRYLCAENEFIKWGWYSMLRLTLGPPQQLVDNYNNQLGVPQTISRSESITSNGDCSMSSGCISEVDEENAFDVDYPDGGTIRRKPTTVSATGDNLPLPPPPMPQGDLTPTGNGHLPLPPPPPPEDTLANGKGEENGGGEPVVAIREELYPCGVMRTRHPGNNHELTPADISQLSLLQQLPSQPPPSLQALMEPQPVVQRQQTPHKAAKKITFSEYVHNFEASEWEPLKGREDEGSEDTSTEASSTIHKEQDVSNWVLDSLRHCNGAPPNPNSTPAPAPSDVINQRPKLYNGRTVPNCFSPEEVHAQQRLQQQAVVQQPCNGRKFPPPMPPTRSDGTYLTH